MKQSSFHVEGTVSGVRDLANKKTGDVFAHVVAVAAIGMTFELRTRDLEMARRASALKGREVVCRGGFSSWNNRIDLDLASIDPVGVAPSAAPVPAKA